MEQDHPAKATGISAMNAIDFELKPKWATGLRGMAQKYKGPNQRMRTSTRTLINDGEVPIRMDEYQVVVTDLVLFGYADILAVVLAHLPAEVTELVLRARNIGNVERGDGVLKVLVDAVLTSPKTTVDALHFRGFDFSKKEILFLADGVAQTGTLQILGLEKCRFLVEQADMFFASLLQTNKTLKSLRLMEMSSVFPEFAKHFETNQTVVHLKVESMCSRPRTAGISDVNDPDGIIPLLTIALKKQRLLVSFECDDARFLDQDWIKIINSFSQHPKLKRLTLGGVLTPAPAKALAEMMATVPTLTELFICLGQLGTSKARLQEALKAVAVLEVRGRGVTPAELLDLLRPPMNGTTLTHLKLYSPQFGPRRVAEIADLIKKNATLKYLGLCYSIEKRVQPIIDAMEFNKSISELDLSSSCDMSNLSLEGLKKNENLVKLVLSGNKLDKAACEKIAPFIARHPSIESMELDICEIGPEGIKIIGEALRGSASIRSLSLVKNSCSREELAPFVKQLKLNHGLVSLKLKPMEFFEHGSQLDDDIPADAVAEGLLNNHSLIYFDNRSYFTLAPALSRKIDLQLQKNLVNQDPAVMEYLRGFVLKFAGVILKNEDVGDVIWQHFVKAAPGTRQGGLFADMAALRDVLHVRQVTLGSPEYRTALMDDPEEVIPKSAEHPASGHPET